MYNDRISSGNQAVSRISGRSPYYLQDSDEEEKKIEGKSLEDCKAKLYNLYGTNYKITGQKQSLKGGFFGWGQKETVEVRYIPNPKPISSPSDAFQKSRDEILSNMTGNGSVTNVMQLSMIDKKLEETQKTLDEKMNLLIQATKAADKPASIAEIEDILQKNEFTFEYINKIIDNSERLSVLCGNVLNMSKLENQHHLCGAQDMQNQEQYKHYIL